MAGYLKQVQSWADSNDCLVLEMVWKGGEGVSTSQEGGDQMMVESGILVLRQQEYAHYIDGQNGSCVISQT